MEDAARVADRANSSAHGQWDEYLASGARDDVGHGVAIVAGSRDVEKNQLIRALFVVAGGELHRITGVAQVDEVHAFDHSAGSDVETGDDALG